MRRLFLIRHAKAEPAVGRDDYERRLTERGRADARRVAAALAARKMLPDVLVHSGAARAKETAEIFAAEWPRRSSFRKSPGFTTRPETMLFARDARPARRARARRLRRAQSGARRARDGAGRLGRRAGAAPPGGRNIRPAPSPRSTFRVRRVGRTSSASSGDCWRSYLTPCRLEARHGTDAHCPNRRRAA